MALQGTRNYFAALELAGEEEPTSQPGGRALQESVVSRRGRVKRLSGRKWIGGESMVGDWLPLRIASYNVLAKCYAKQKHFTACKPEHLRWNERRAALIEVIEELDADVLCLQEVEDYEKFWLKELNSRGYSGVYKKRNSERKYDGCATFYRSAKFEKIDTCALEFDEVTNPQNSDDSESLPDFATHNVALLTVLRPRWRSGGCFCLANAHLFWDPSYEELKISQARALVRVAGEVSALHGGVPIILAGDFNSVPESCVYKFLTSEASFTSAYAQVSSTSNGRARTEKQEEDSHTSFTSAYSQVSSTSNGRARTEAQEEDSKAPHKAPSAASPFLSSPGKLTFAFTKALNPDSPVFRPGLNQNQSVEPPPQRELAPDSPVFRPSRNYNVESPPQRELALRGAGAERWSSTGEPAFTNYRDIFNGAIDFIFYRGGSVDARACLGMIGEADARREGGGLPNSRHPSDHLPIAVDLAISFDSEVGVASVSNGHAGHGNEGK